MIVVLVLPPGRGPGPSGTGSEAAPGSARSQRKLDQTAPNEYQRVWEVPRNKEKNFAE